MASLVRVLGLLAALAASGVADRAFAQSDAGSDYYVAMRSFAVGDGPRFVLAATQANEERSTAIEACDGAVYYLRADDAGIFQEALNAGDTVQLHAAIPGTSPVNAAIVCLFQAAESEAAE